MAQHRRQMHAAANAMIKYELSDTSGLDLAAYRQWLLNKESLEAAYERAASYPCGREARLYPLTV